MCDSLVVIVQGHEMIPIRPDPHRPDHDQIYVIKSTSNRPDHGQISVTKPTPYHPDQGQFSRRSHAKLGAKAFRHNVDHG